MTLDKKFPSISYMEAAAAKRMPKFVHDYMVGGIGAEVGVQRNRDALNNVLLSPRYLSDAKSPNIKTHILGYEFDAPFGVAPLGLSGLMWPDLEAVLADAAKQHNIPYALSTYACASLERIKPIAGDNGWFQYYPSDLPDVEKDILDRCKNAGYKTLLLTVDIPVETRRERDMHNGLSVPPSFDLRTLWQMMTRPAWALGMLRMGVPEFETLKPYYPPERGIFPTGQFVHQHMKGHITAERFKSIRDYWQGHLIVKGILSADEAQQYMALGADGIVVSNHGGRQLDAAPTTVSVLPDIRAALGDDVPLFADSGVRSGLDIARMLALGADFVLLGRPFVYGVAAAGRAGGAHAMYVLKEELTMTMAQLGCREIGELGEFLVG